MISRLPHSVLSLVFGLGPWITAGQGKAVPCQEIFTVCEQPYTEMELLEKYAPDILHWVSNEVEEQYQDYMVSIGFDEYRDGERKPMAEWVGHDNWEHADQLQFNGSPRERPRAVLYGGVVSVTKSQVYLVYYYFHPRDYVAGPLGKTLHVLGKLAFQSAFHENDLEGGMLVVDRPDGKVVHAYAMAHNGFDPGFPFWPSWSVYDSRLPAAMQRFSHCCQVLYSFRCRSGLRMLADHGVPAKPEGPLATPLPRRPSATRVRWLFRAVDVTLRAQVAPKSAAACRRTTCGSDAPPQAATNNIARASRAVRPSSSADAASSSATSF